MRFTFGIVTGGGADFFVKNLIASIRSEQVPEYEIIIIGDSMAFGYDITVVPFDETVKKGWFTRKKNLIAQMAKYENIVILHDYLKLQTGWYKGYLKYGNDFNICVNPLLNKQNERCNDFLLFFPIDGLSHSIKLLPYEFKPTIIQSKLIYAAGSYYVIKKSIALKYPYNEDLAMKAPILRLAPGDNRGDIDIANETINYFAKPTIVKSLKGQGGADLDALSGIGIPLKITGSFSNPKFGMDFASLGTAITKSNLLDKVGGEKGGAVNELLGNGTKDNALKNLFDKKKPGESSLDANSGTTTTTVPAEVPKSNEDQIKDKATSKLKKMLNF